MGIILTAVHVVAAFVLVLVVLLQQGKGADMGAVFGGSSSTIFGSSGAGNFLTKLTTGAAVLFMITSLSLTYLSSHRLTESVFDSSSEPPPLNVPAADEQAAPDAAQPAEPAEGAAPEAAPAADEGAAAPAPEAAAPAEAPAPAPAADGQAAAPAPEAPAAAPN